MYIRFVVEKIDPDSGKRQGIFQTIANLKKENKLYSYETDRVTLLEKWFDEHLSKPASFSRSAKPHAHKKALSWFKDTAIEHIAKIRECAAIIEEHGINVSVIQSERPGYIVYEDVYQITAEPYKDTGAE